MQDDANFIALIEPASGQVDALALPAGQGGLRQFDDLRGNKRFKLDLEACFSAPWEDGEAIIAMGSGSSEQRQTIVIIPADGRIEMVDAGRLYQRLRSEAAFSGSEMNIEGAAYIAGTVRLFNRGNGAASGGLAAVNASCDVLWSELAAYLRQTETETIPALQRIVQYDLGLLNDSALTFTDAAVTELGLLYTATAEHSPDAVTDGAVAGSALGVIAHPHPPRWIELNDAAGGLLVEKIEGICPARQGSAQIYAIIDADDPAQPSELCEIVLGGPWAIER
jgi:hypothetical protein